MNTESTMFIKSNNLWKKYPSIKRVELEEVASVVGRLVYWQVKRDGSNISLIKKDGRFYVYTRNQLAIQSVQSEVKTLIPDLPESKYIIYGELIREGKSPAQFEIHKESSFWAFDAYDTEEERFLTPPDASKVFEEFNLNYIPVAFEEVYQSQDEFKNRINHLIDVAAVLGLEGFVAKWFTEVGMMMIKAKVEHKYRNEKVCERKKQGVGLPPLDVSEEEKKHEAKFKGKLFNLYIEFLEDLKESTDSSVRR
ncbi:MAG: RNA ligase family protein [Candidatus Thorarchaeota archaeon]